MTEAQITMGPRPPRPPTLWQRIKRGDDGVFAVVMAILVTVVPPGFAGLILTGSSSHLTLGILLMMPAALLLGGVLVAGFITLWVWALRDWRKYGS
jgi:uncharacterized membrane protein